MMQKIFDILKVNFAPQFRMDLEYKKSVMADAGQPTATVNVNADAEKVDPPSLADSKDIEAARAHS
jgi:hypothetical protein